MSRVSWFRIIAVHTKNNGLVHQSVTNCNYSMHQLEIQASKYFLPRWVALVRLTRQSTRLTLAFTGPWRVLSVARKRKSLRHDSGGVCAQVEAGLRLAANLCVRSAGSTRLLNGTVGRMLPPSHPRTGL